MERQKGLLYTVMLDMGSTWTETVDRDFPDVFDPAWAARVDRIAALEVAPRKDDASLLGYFIDNELNWGGRWPAGGGCSRQYPALCKSNSLLTWFLLRKGGTPGNAAAMSFLRRRYVGGIGELNAA